jgi:hypothetical protein
VTPEIGRERIELPSEGMDAREPLAGSARERVSDL